MKKITINIINNFNNNIINEKHINMFLKNPKKFAKKFITNNGEVYIPYGVKTIPERAFYEKFKFSDTVNWLEGNIYSKKPTKISKITNVFIPSTVVSIGKSAFSGQNNLGKLVIPNTVQNIDRCCFYNVKANEIVLPQNIKVLKENLFSGAKIEKFRIPDSVEIFEENCLTFHKNYLHDLIIKNENAKITTQLFDGLDFPKKLEMPIIINDINAIHNYKFPERTIFTHSNNKFEFTNQELYDLKFLNKGKFIFQYIKKIAQHCGNSLQPAYIIAALEDNVENYVNYTKNGFGKIEKSEFFKKLKFIDKVDVVNYYKSMGGFKNNLTDSMKKSLEKNLVSYLKGKYNITDNNTFKVVENSLTNDNGKTL